MTAVNYQHSWTLEGFTELCPGAPTGDYTVTYDGFYQTTGGGLQPCHYGTYTQFDFNYNAVLDQFTQNAANDTGILTLTMDRQVWNEVWQPNGGPGAWSASGLVAPVPEPSSALLLAGALGLAIILMCWRKTK